MKTTNTLAAKSANIESTEKPFSVQIRGDALQSLIRKSVRSAADAARLTGTLISAVAANEKLRDCAPHSIVAAALRGAAANRKKTRIPLCRGSGENDRAGRDLSRYRAFRLLPFRGVSRPCPRGTHEQPAGRCAARSGALRTFSGHCADSRRGNVRRKRFSESGRLRQPAVSRRRLYLYRQPVSVRSGVPAAGPGSGTSVLDGSRRGLDRQNDLVRDRPAV